MNFAFTTQKFQDWFTQQWVILWGRKINPTDYPWLIAPFGELNGIGEEFIYQLAEKENLIVIRNSTSKGLLNSINELNLTDNQLENLSKKVIDFYECTANYNLEFNVKWNSFFTFFGYLVNQLFSQRINQLNIPTKNITQSEDLESEIITLNNQNNEVKYTIWLRKFKTSGKVIYSGIYGTCILPSNRTCIKAVFPLPKGNATVIMKASVGNKKELILDSSGKKFGDTGFYFLLNDAKYNYWAQFISSFTDQLIIKEKENNLQAIQTLKLWNFNVSQFTYYIQKK
ncbi:hypothetical protein [Empedobacter tilapiae]|uniref:Uncharacterized protein n=1 Tax=Empedobacter tilapiae TaxID=2491114 RepID=A0A4Z1AYQ8_9FLAO|nr:hypothetical protein [Empedobacter tilapiae]TGN22576.1 hypothetical protein E4J94_16165 [Empedobacter tilapiae]